jgi:hypothetical protein
LFPTIKARGLSSRRERGSSERTFLLESRYAHVYQFVPVTIVVIGGPLKVLKDELHALLKVQSAKVDAIYAIFYQFPNHVSCELYAVVFDELVVMLHKNEVIIGRELSRSRTLILSRSARIKGGTEVPQSFVIRRKDA